MSLAKIPLGRLVTPQDVGNMVGFLTGQKIHVDGSELMM